MSRSAPLTLTDDDFDSVLSPREAIDARAKAYGLKLSSGKRTQAQNLRAGGSPTSNHLTGRANDYAGAPEAMKAFTQEIAKNYGGSVRELYHDPVGGWKRGKSIGAIGKHSDHVHVAFDDISSTSSNQRFTLTDDDFEDAVQAPPKNEADALVRELTAANRPSPTNALNNVARGVANVAAKPVAKPSPNVPYQPSAAEQQLARYFEEYKAAGNLPEANKYANELKTKYGWSMGSVRADSPDGNLFGTEWTYIKPPGSQGIENKVSQGTEAFVNSGVANREARERRERIKAQQNAKRQKQGLVANAIDAVKEAGEGAAMGLTSWAGDRVAGAGRLLEEGANLLRSSPPGSTVPAIRPRQATAGESIQAAGEKASQASREYQADFGQSLPSQAGAMVGELAPDLVLAGLTGAPAATFGTSSALSSYGQGKPLAESILTGVVNARGMEGGNVLAAELEQLAKGSLGRYGARALAQGLQNVGTNAAMQGDFPDTPEKAAKEILFALGFGLFPTGHPKDAAAKQSAIEIATHPETNPEVAAAIERAVRPVRTADEIRGGQRVEREILPTDTVQSGERAIDNNAIRDPRKPQAAIEAILPDTSIPASVEVKPMAEAKGGEVKEPWQITRSEFEGLTPAYHVTSAGDAIQREGFRTKQGGGVGGEGSKIYTSADSKYSAKLAAHLNEVKKILSSDNPIREASNYTGIPAKAFEKGGQLRGMIDIYEKRAGRPLTQTEEAAVIAFNGPGASFPETAPKLGTELERFLKSPDYSVVEVRGRNPQRTHQGMGGEIVFKEGDAFRSDHRAQIENALKQGKPVPPEVLADYPDLAPDRRTDLARRKRVDEMSEDEMRKELHSHELTGMPNRRAYEEAPKKPVQISYDVAGLKFANDTVHPSFGDEVLKTVAKAMQEESPDTYHLKGDEYAGQADDEAGANAQAKAVQERLKNATITYTAPDGTTRTFKGIDLHYGIGKDITEADTRLNEGKATRKSDASGRTEPTGLVEVTATGRQVQNQPAGQEVTHHSQIQNRADDGKFIEGKQAERALPKTLESAGLESGSNTTYKPATIAEGISAAKTIVKEKGIDGAMEWAKNPDNDGIEWASVGYEALSQSREAEAKLRQTDPAAADAIAERRLSFLDSFAEQATKKGQSIVGIKAIEEFAPDRAAYTATKLSKANRKRGLSAEEEARIVKTAEQLTIANDRIKNLEKQLEAKKRSKKVSPATKESFQAALEAQSKAVAETLKAKMGKLDFGVVVKSSERGSVTIREGNEPPLKGDAELLAQYAAGRLNKVDTLADLKAELVKEFGESVSPHLSSISRRAYSIRQEARLKEIATSSPSQRRTILQEIQKEIADLQKTRQQAGKIKELSLSPAEIRSRLVQARREYIQASEAGKKAYRVQQRESRKAERQATVWDAPIRGEAKEARLRLASADPKAPTTLEDLTAVAAEKLLPVSGGLPRMGTVFPSKFYSEMQSEFPNLVSKKNRGEIYKRATERLKDATEAAREVARLKSADKESRKMWDELGIDEEAQAIMIRRAEALRQQQEARAAMIQEFNHVSKSKPRRFVGELFSLPRALQSSIDAPLGRQGLFYLVTHPIQTMRYAVPGTIKGYSAIRRGTYESHVKELQAHPDYDLAKQSGLSGSTFEGGSEEQFRSGWGDKIPHARLSEQAFNLGMDSQRMAVFSKYADYGRAEGYTFESNPDFFKQAAEFVNAATGRAKMPELMEKAKPLLNTIFYSPRLQVSRIKLLNNLLNPQKYLSYDPAMRKIAVGEALKAVVGFGLIYGAFAALSKKDDKVKMTADPASSDFGKVVVGNTHYDLSGGEAGLIRAFYRLAQSIGKGATGEKVEYGKDAATILGQWFRTKLAPVPGAALNVAAGKDLVGKPANLKIDLSKKVQTFQQNQLLKLIAPMLSGDLTEAIIDDGWMGAVKTIPALGGFGTNTYPTKNSSNGASVQQFLQQRKQSK